MKTDSEKMEMHLEYSSLSMAMYSRNEKDGIHFNLLEVPILNILARETEQKFGWKYPSQETLKQFQEYRGLENEMLNQCEVQEIMLKGTQSEEEQLKIIQWHQDRMKEDNDAFPCNPLSFDVEQVRCTLKDVLRLGGQVKYNHEDVVLSDAPGSEYYRTHKDWYVQLPVRCM